MKGNKQKFITAISLVMMIVATTFAAIPTASATELTANLVIDGRNTSAVVGTVVVDNSSTDITVTYTVDPVTNGGWSLSETHVYVGTESPTKSSPGRFPYVAEPTDDPNVWTCTVSLNDLGVSPGDIVYVAAHAALTKTIYDDDGNVIEVLEESGWAQAGGELDSLIPPYKNWATYFEYTLEEISV